MKLRINADDFGISEDISKGIIYSKQRKLIDTFSTMVNSQYSREAISYILESNKRESGIHVTLVGGEKSIIEAHKFLTDHGGGLKEKYNFLFNFLNKKHLLEEIETEVNEQIKSLLKSKIKITHIDSHQHIHILPWVSDIFLKFMQVYRIPAIRTPVSLNFTARGSLGLVINYFSKQLRNKCEDARIITYNSYGFDCSGRLTSEFIQKIVATKISPFNGDFELMAHPGFSGESNSKYLSWKYKWVEEINELERYHKNKSI